MPNSPDPLTAEEEAAVRSWNADGPPGFGRGVAALEIVPRLLATLDAARSDLDGAKRLNTDLLSTLPIEDTSKPVPTTGPDRKFIGYTSPPAAALAQPEPLDRLRSEIEAELAGVPDGSGPFYDGAAAAYHWVLSSLSETPR